MRKKKVDLLSMSAKIKTVFGKTMNEVPFHQIICDGAFGKIAIFEFALVTNGKEAEDGEDGDFG